MFQNLATSRCWLPLSRYLSVCVCLCLSLSLSRSLSLLRSLSLTPDQNSTTQHANSRKQSHPKTLPEEELLVKNRWRQLRQQMRFSRCPRPRESQVVLFADAMEGGLAACGSLQESAAPNMDRKPTGSLIEAPQHGTPN